MTPELINKRVELHKLLSTYWRCLEESKAPRVEWYEYRGLYYGRLRFVAVCIERWPDKSLQRVVLRWVVGGKKDKCIKAAEIDEMILYLKTVNQL